MLAVDLAKLFGSGDGRRLKALIEEIARMEGFDRLQALRAATDHLTQLKEAAVKRRMRPGQVAAEALRQWEERNPA